MDTKMIEVKTADLIVPALDWAVAHATKAWEWAHEWFPAMTLDPTFRGVSDNATYGHVSLIPRNPMRQDSQPFMPSTDWAQGGRLIEKHQVSLHCPQSTDDVWAAWIITDSEEVAQGGDTALVAACRAIVAANLGDTLSIPAELVKP